MKKSIGKPYEGKLHVRFDEGGADSLIYYVIFGNMMKKKGYQALLYWQIKLCCIRPLNPSMNFRYRCYLNVSTFSVQINLIATLKYN